MDSKLPVTGAVLASFGSALSWLCCLPFALSILSAGTATMAGAIAPFRPYLIGLSLAFLALGFYAAYRPETSCEGDHCPTGRSRRSQRVMLWIAAGLTVAMITVGYWSSWVIYWTL